MGRHRWPSHAAHVQNRCMLRAQHLSHDHQKKHVNKKEGTVDGCALTRGALSEARRGMKDSAITAARAASTSCMGNTPNHVCAPAAGFRAALWCPPEPQMTLLGAGPQTRQRAIVSQASSAPRNSAPFDRNASCKRCQHACRRSATYTGSSKLCRHLHLGRMAHYVTRTCR